MMAALHDIGLARQNGADNYGVEPAPEPPEFLLTAEIVAAKVPA